MLLEMSPNGAEQCQGWSCNIAKCKTRNVAEQSYLEKVVREAYGRWNELEEIDHAILNDNALAFLTQGMLMTCVQLEFCGDVMIWRLLVASMEHRFRSDAYSLSQKRPLRYQKRCL
ncbi:hypothetical protein PIB30_081441 [Stylosanthes scabra]|uniref:Uncharacterized protein n=1 Tax=Stylosanthes scabra TaxID=79078 RepID=A0ABU6ZQB0_9FABA|nr:hypothetical protein [Stylosanthes scabra]